MTTLPQAWEGRPGEGAHAWSLPSLLARARASRCSSRVSFFCLLPLISPCWVVPSWRAHHFSHRKTIVVSDLVGTQEAAGTAIARYYFPVNPGFPWMRQKQNWVYLFGWFSFSSEAVALQHCEFKVRRIIPRLDILLQNDYHSSSVNASPLL